MNESNGPGLADLFVFPSAPGSTGALLATAALSATGTVAALLAAAATLLATLAALLAPATLLAAALSATGTVAALLAAAALPATLIALGNQLVQVIVSIIESISAIPSLWSFHGVFLFAEEGSALRTLRVFLSRSKRLLPTRIVGAG